MRQRGNQEESQFQPPKSPDPTNLSTPPSPGQGQAELSDQQKQEGKENVALEHFPTPPTSCRLWPTTPTCPPQPCDKGVPEVPAKELGSRPSHSTRSQESRFLPAPSIPHPPTLPGQGQET